MSNADGSASFSPPPSRRSRATSPSSTTVQADASVESQTEALLVKGTIWSAVVNAQLHLVAQFVRTNPLVLEERGPVGETPLHLACLLNSPAHLQIARFMLQEQPRLIGVEYEGTEYLGENCLHIAIVNRQLPLVRYLLDLSPKLLDGRAVGKFFSPGQPCYYGEYPFLFAACTLQYDVIECLMEYGADVFVSDSHGNNVLHLLVIHELPNMYDYVCDQLLQGKADEVEALQGRVNEEGLTPLTLAAKMGSVRMFNHLLERKKQVQWTYGPVSCQLFPLTEFDTRIEKKTEPRGALELIVEKEQLDLLMLPRVVELLRKKWARFAERQFKQRMYFTLLFLMILTITSSLPRCVASDDPIEYFSAAAMRYVGEAFVFGATLFKTWLELREISSVGFRAYLTLSGCGFLENVLSFCFCTLMLSVFGLRMVDSPWEQPALALSIVVAYAYLSFFFLGFRKTGPFVVMIYKMMIADMARFGIIWIAFLLGFTNAFLVLFDESGFFAYLDRAKACFLAMLGGFEFDDYVNTSYPFITVILLVLYIFLVSILMLNLLIAMMSDTFARVNEQADRQWHLEWARIIISIENEMSVRERLAAKYWVEVNGKRYLQVQEVIQEEEETCVQTQLANIREELARLQAIAFPPASASKVSPGVSSNQAYIPGVEALVSPVVSPSTSPLENKKVSRGRFRRITRSMVKQN